MSASCKPRALDGRILRCGIISLCQSAATSEIIKRFWSCLSHVRSAIESAGLYLYLSVFQMNKGQHAELQ